MTNFGSILAAAAAQLVPNVAVGPLASAYYLDGADDYTPDYIVQLPRADGNATFFESHRPPTKRAVRRAAAKAKEAVRLAKARKDCGHEG